MLWPDSAKDAIAKAFYDKVIVVLNSTTTKDSEGGIVRNSQSVKTSFKGNVRFNDLGELQAELGLVESIDISVTCNTNAEIELNDIFRYNSQLYVATHVIPSDSHLTVIGKKWQEQNSQ